MNFLESVFRQHELAGFDEVKTQLSQRWSELADSTSAVEILAVVWQVLRRCELMKGKLGRFKMCDLTVEHFVHYGHLVSHTMMQTLAYHPP